MKMQMLPWINDDVAIEIIGKMIAEQTEQVHKIVAEYSKKGVAHDSQEVTSDCRYRETVERINDLRREIDQIYNGEGLSELYKKVDEVYVLHLRQQQMIASA